MHRLVQQYNFEWEARCSWRTRNIVVYLKIKVKWSRYRPGVAQRVGRDIALLFHGRGTRRGWVVSSTPQSHFTLGKDPVSILQEGGWAPGSVCTGGKSRPHQESIPDRPARSQSLYQLSYPAHLFLGTLHIQTYQHPFLLPRILCGAVKGYWHVRGNVTSIFFPFFLFVPEEIEENDENHRFRICDRDSKRLPPEWMTGALSLHHIASTDNRDVYGDSKWCGKNRCSLVACLKPRSSTADLSALSIRPGLQWCISWIRSSLFVVAWF